MVAPIQIGAGITIEGGVKVGPHGIYEGISTQSYQNTAGSDSATGLFFQNGGWPYAPTPSYYDIQPGWTVDGLPGATVVSTDPLNQTVTISGGVFIAGQSYAFIGI